MVLAVPVGKEGRTGFVSYLHHMIMVTGNERMSPHTGWDHSHLTHWGRVLHICVGDLTIIGSDNGLLPGRHQAITWTNVGILLTWPLGTNYSEMLIEIHIFSFKKIHLKMPSGKWRPFCLSLNVLNINLLRPSDAIWRQKIWLDIDSDNGSLADVTKPSTEPMLTLH